MAAVFLRLECNWSIFCALTLADFGFVEKSSVGSDIFNVSVLKACLYVSQFSTKWMPTFENAFVRCTFLGCFLLSELTNLTENILSEI